MNFHEAAVAYELLQEGCVQRIVAKEFGISVMQLQRIIKQCLELGKAAPLVNEPRDGRPRAIPLEKIKQAMVMHDQGHEYKDIARILGVDPSQLRKSVWHYNHYRRTKALSKDTQ